MNYIATVCRCSYTVAVDLSGQDDERHNNTKLTDNNRLGLVPVLVLEGLSFRGIKYEDYWYILFAV
jgi:hypothetical protein